MSRSTALIADRFARVMMVALMRGIPPETDSEED
jgi:hypothetical protein